MQRIILIAIFVLVGSIAYAAAPVLFFSDMTDGVNQGGHWGGDQEGNGAAVTIWGLNFGSSGSISCGGQTVLSTSCPEWAATTNPTTARGLERITFYLTSAMSTGTTTISVTTSEGTSGTVPFYVRNTGNIYFVDDASGSDTENNGLYSTDSGSNGPFASPGKLRSVLTAGDCGYIRAGTYDKSDATGSFQRGIITLRPGYYNNGTSNNSISVSSYPGEMAILDADAAYNSDSIITGCITKSYSTTSQLNYWTFSKMYLKGKKYCVVNYLDSGSETNSTSHLRFIGMEMTAPYNETSGGVLGMDLGGGSGGTDLLSILGNYIHDLNQDYRGDTSGVGVGGRTYPIYLEGYGYYNTVEVGWNELCYIIDGRGCQIYGHKSSDYLTNLYFHDNYIHDVENAPEVPNSVTMNGNDGGGTLGLVRNGYFYNNILSYHDAYGFMSNTGVAAGNKTYIYNNILYPSSTASLAHVAALSTTAEIYLYNNIFAKSGSSIREFDSNTSGTMAGSNNLLYNATKASWDTSTLTATDPLFTDSTPDDGSYSDFFPTESSPTRDAGTALTYGAPNDTYDFYGVARGDTWDIGAFEYTTGSSPSTPSITGTVVRGTVQ